MGNISKSLIRSWASLGPKFLPFADAATPEVPLPRLLRLSLFQVSVGMALVLLIGTLNRVLIVELKVPASIVSIMISIPLIFAPFRAVIGFRSDTHRSALGWKRVPYIWMGTLVQFGGFAMMPFALLVLSGAGHANEAPVWIGWFGAGISFLLVGAGLHTTQTVGLALANDLVPKESQPNAVGLMYVMLLLSMIGCALLFGELLREFTPGRLIQVIQGAALATMVLNITALWKQETRRPSRFETEPQKTMSFQEAWHLFTQNTDSVRRLIAVGIGTMAFSMEDILLEPYGGEVLGLTVGQTTTLTATLAGGGLLGFGLASYVLNRGFDPFKMASLGAAVGIPAFLLVIFSGNLQMAELFASGVFLIGFGGGLFGHGTLTATMQNAPAEQCGLALGAWGAVQASAAGLAIALGGIIRDVVAAKTSVLNGYVSVYAIEVVLLLATIWAMYPLIMQRRKLQVIG
ncbi:PucC family protein [Polynucleobacter kasalickyi]|uniref:MFS transporter, BCD family, chlorophyll transporter n=1 Tax=Polynucleobacter kasalickyi TaxID=1938817 RepID=A0A1W1YLW7_9BURK|nr:PucC family protein [Polynucleobacter kasalickyi]SMC37230.1 MFS transporter, BCD family, chlorophyll transporter [Polynucleobacter kasalickyi]